MKPTISSVPKRLHHLIDSDIMLNVGLRESFIRGLGAIFILIPGFSFTDHRLLYWSIPVVVYLYVSALSHFCIIKYAWRHWLHHGKDPLLKDLPAELYVPGVEP